MTTYTPVSYTIDPENRIVAVNNGWDIFAEANQGESITGGAVIGHSVLDFISGKVTKEYWRSLLERARHSTQALHIDYRCDAPHIKRWMRMELSLLDNGNVCISHTQLAAEKRNKPIHFEIAQQRGKSSYIRCSQCNKIKQREVWLEAESLSETIKINTLLQVVYGLCADCITLSSIDSS
ncbi:MAG: hypothetical protein V4445_04735 [Pseudomonadota bacterium]